MGRDHGIGSEAGRCLARVVLVVLDAFPHALVDPGLTPNLAALADEGGRSHAGGVAEATAATYPNHATFVTGRSTLDHGMMANRVRRAGGWIPAAEAGPAAPTLFEACRAEGRTTAAAVGDQNLIGVCGAALADEHWPPAGVVPEGTPRSLGGYLPDAEVLGALDGIDLDALDLLFVQLDEVDGVRHRFGAWGDETREQCHRTDAAFGRLVERLRPRWDDTVLLVVSDHDQEDIGPQEPVDLADQLPDGVEVCHQGTASLVVGPIGEDALLALPGVVGVLPLGPDHHVVWGAPGQLFGRDHGLRAEHGSPRTATQLALVAGGHPTATALAGRLEGFRPPAVIWATWAAAALGLAWRPGQPLPNRSASALR